MILASLNRSNVGDNKLWELVEQTNQLTQGGYDDWDSNAQTLMPLMQRIIMFAREKEEWYIYFYVMSKLFWFSRRTEVNNIRLSFQIAEMFHQDYQSRLGERLSDFGREYIVNLAGNILEFYGGFPQIDDLKLEQMLKIFRECEAIYGSDWNCGDYTAVMYLALLNKDMKLAEEAADKLKKTPFINWCYMCTYGRPMIGYYILHNDLEMTVDWIYQLIDREMPKKYQWFLKKCQQAEAEDLVDLALQYSLWLGNIPAFHKFFHEWREIYQKPEKEVEDTHDVLFHAVGGDWSHQEERVQLAQQDDRDMREQRETPLDCFYWFLCWHCYFILLDRKGVRSVSIELGEEGKHEWSCLDVAQYFERQADIIGEQMDRARKQFRYKEVKHCYKECCLNSIP